MIDISAYDNYNSPAEITFNCVDSGVISVNIDQDRALTRIGNKRNCWSVAQSSTVCATRLYPTPYPHITNFCFLYISLKPYQVSSS